MAFTIDQAAFERAINEGLRKVQPEMIEQARAVIEAQYCPVHGQFAEIVDVHGQIAIDHPAQLEIRTCCDALQEQVRAVTQDAIEDES